MATGQRSSANDIPVVEQSWGVFNCPRCNSTHAALSGIDSFPIFDRYEEKTKLISAVFDEVQRARPAITSVEALMTMTKKMIATINVPQVKTLTTTVTTTNTKSSPPDKRLIKAEPASFKTGSSEIDVRSSLSDDEKCSIHELERSMFCKEDGCQRNVIAPENSFVYCRDPDIVDTIRRPLKFNFSRT